MSEIAATFEGAALPGGFHAAAAEIFHRLADLKELEGESDLGEVVARLLERPAGE